MYGAIWRALPGPAIFRILVLLIVAAAICIALVAWVFPYVDGLIAPQNVTVGGAPSS